MYFTKHQPGKEGRNIQQNSRKTTQGAEAAEACSPTEVDHWEFYLQVPLPHVSGLDVGFGILQGT
jgi:hypothetical protein